MGLQEATTEIRRMTVYSDGYVYWTGEPERATTSSLVVFYADGSARVRAETL